MSRKDLSRTVIEGGRYYHNTFFRRESHRTARASTREWLSSIEHDPDEADASSPEPLRPVHKRFYDKLAPARRWLASQVGRPWSKVYSELRARFDSRTIAGAHVVNDHMLGWVAQHGLSPTRRDYDFQVDAHGILRHGRYYQISYQKLRAELAAWQAGRKACLTYRGWWWVRVVPRDPYCYSRWSCRQPHIDGYHRADVLAVCPLTKGDRRRLDRIPDDFRASVVLARCEVRF